MLLLEDLTIPSLPGFRFLNAPVGEPNVLQELEERGFFVAAIDGGSVNSDTALFHVLGQAFNFPDYFGENWDAFEECIRDLEWVPAAGYICVVRDTETFFRVAPRTAGMLLEIWAHASVKWSKEQTPFHLILVWQATAV
jgi:hypothetical protein